ncbi:putative F-box/FBD/LRR-repeat protein At5g56810 [Lolium rigidum]|uniref:putative F-box/FBD/LRR-repeat protein At5g56810 n=1 Tax=Lolium rigidum TaxID=89674 RepID=UPI001F5D10C9|nr:putative F-box/FBD/LRR-repeat protein At5g56810 [Lolium rigidum]
MQLQKAAINEDKPDRLSQLPKDVLLNILERADSLDAVRTCILSSQLRNLPTMLSQIVIAPDNRDLVRMTGVSAHLINKILSTRSPQITIRKLQVRFVLIPSDCRSIGKYVGLAMATHKVDAAEFEVVTPRNSYHCAHADLLKFAKQFSMFVADCPDAFAGLTQLILQNLRFGESDIPNILSTCKRLESLCCFECDAGIRSVLHVEHARLVELDLTYGEFLTVELSCLPKLQRMTYNNWPSDDNPLVLNFVPQLSKLNLANAGLSNNTLKLSQLLANVPSVSDLYLDFRSEKIWIQPECPRVLAPVLGQLRFVNLDCLPEECDITWTMFLLEAARFVEDLCITVWDHKCGSESQNSYSEKTDVKWEPSAPNFKHKNLAKLTIYGFQSDGNFMGYVRRVMEAAVNIKDVSLLDRKVCKLCADKFPHIKLRPSTYPQSCKEKDSLRKKITEASVMMASPAVIHFRS